MTWVSDLLGLQPKQFRYSLVYQQKTYVLPNAPIGWEENIIRWSRSEFYYGMIRSFSVPLKFVLDGAWILRTGFYTYGIRGNALLTIEELNLATWGYELIYSGDIDFSTFTDSLTEVTVTAMEGGLSANIKAYENVKYTIPLNVPDAVDIQLTGLKLLESALFLFTPAISYPITLNNQVIFDLQLIQNETQSIVPSVQQVDWQSLGVPPPTPNLTANEGWFYRANGAGTINVKGFVSGQNFMIYIRDETYAIIETIGGSVDGSDFNINFDYDISVTDGQRLFITGTTFTVGGGPQITDGEFTGSFTTIAPDTMCKALRPKYLFEQLLLRMNQGAPVSIQSFLLDEWEQLCITSGVAIRELENPVIITSFKDFFTSINSVLNAGFGIESGKAVLEKKAYWFKSTLQAADVGENKSFNLEVYEAYLASSVKIGYPDQQFSTIINGRDEVNSTQVYSLPITRVQKELDLLSIYRADPYGIEDLRITKQDGDTTNNNNDNDVFFVKIKADPENISGTPYYRPERSEGYLSLSGVLAAETYYNWDISPHRNLLRHGDFLHSILDKFDGAFINFESALKNSSMNVVGLNGQRTIEDQDLSIGTLPDKIFLPYLITIVTKLPKNAMNLVDNFPTGYIRSQFLNNNQDGFIIDFSVDVSKNRQRELKLLLTPFNQLENLIH